MTKHESEILSFLKDKTTVSRETLLNTFKDTKCGNYSYIRTDDRIDALSSFDYIYSAPNSTYFEITPAGLHALDEYLENETRLNKAEAHAKRALIASYVSVAIAAVSLITNALIR